MRVEKISNRQFSFVIFIMRASIVLATLPVLTAAGARQDAWASTLLVFVGTCLLVWLIAGLGTRFPRQDVVEISTSLLGKAAGGLVSLVILWAFLHMASIEVRVYAEMIIVGFLPETPIVFLTASMILIAFVTAYSGVEVIGRTADLVFPIFTGMIILSLLTLLFEADFTNLQPVLSRGLVPVLTGSIAPIAIGSQLLVIGMLVPHLNTPEKAISSSIRGVVGASLVLLVVVILVVATLGAEEGARAVFPFFKAIRSVRISEFLERVEILAVFSWGFGLFVALSTFLYCGARGVARLIGIQDYRHILLPMSIIWIVLSIHDFENVFEIRSLFSPGVLGPYGFFLVLFPYTLLWAGYILRGNGGAGPPGAGGEGRDGEAAGGEGEGEKR